MDCEQFARQLDALIDGELQEAEARAMEIHAGQCAKCAAELRCARRVREMMHGMDDDVTVPLAAQAAWRAGVRREGKRMQVRRLRVFAAAAAAVVVLVGSVALINRPGSIDTLDTEVAQMLSVEEAADVLVERDGAQIVARSAGEEAYACWKKYAVQDFDAACRTLEQLAGEYEGTVTCAEGETGSEATYRIELPGIYLEDFLAAAGTLGELKDSETREWSSDPEIVYIQLNG